MASEIEAGDRANFKKSAASYNARRFIIPLPDERLRNLEVFSSHGHLVDGKTLFLLLLFDII